MNLSKPASLLIGLIASATALFALRHSRNGFFEYCTTTAYGMPFPWEIDHCPCDGRGGLIEHPVWASVLNIGSALLAAYVVSRVLTRWKAIFRHKDSTRSGLSESDP